MTTDELLMVLPSMIGNNPVGNGVYALCDKTDSIESLQLLNDGKHWVASYGESGHYVCMNPRAIKPPYDNAFYIGDTPNEALQGLYEWCRRHNLIKTK